VLLTIGIAMQIAVRKTNRRSVGRRGALDQMRSLILLDTSTLLKTSTGMYGIDYKYTILSPVKTYNVRRFKFIIDSALEEMLLFN
jgi:hypothetical protein